MQALAVLRTGLEQAQHTLKDARLGLHRHQPGWPPVIATACLPEPLTTPQCQWTRKMVMRHRKQCRPKAQRQQLENLGWKLSGNPPLRKQNKQVLYLQQWEVPQ